MTCWRSAAVARGRRAPRARLGKASAHAEAAHGRCRLRVRRSWSCDRAACLPARLWQPPASPLRLPSPQLPACSSQWRRTGPSPCWRCQTQRRTASPPPPSAAASACLSAGRWWWWWWWWGGVVCVCGGGGGGPSAQQWRGGWVGWSWRHPAVAETGPVLAHHRAALQHRRSMPGWRRPCPGPPLLRTLPHPDAAPRAQRAAAVGESNAQPVAAATMLTRETCARQQISSCTICSVKLQKVRYLEGGRRRNHRDVVGRLRRGASLHSAAPQSAASPRRSAPPVKYEHHTPNCASWGSQGRPPSVEALRGAASVPLSTHRKNQPNPCAPGSAAAAGVVCHIHVRT